jgi:SsrA-binding protein
MAKKGKRKTAPGDVATNRSAAHRFNLLEREEAGVVLTGTEVKSLLLHRRQIDRLAGQVNERGATLVPTRIYFKDGRAKVEIALAKGKDRFDKRASIRDREMKRDMDRAVREAQR